VKIILDNCVHYQAKGLFSGHEVLHARDLGWRELSNGELLAKAATEFDVLVTTDKNIRYEHNLSKLPIAVLELNTRFTRISDLRSLAPHLESALAQTRLARFVSVGADGNLQQLGLPKP
jgi:predicted nuclease of predicted toxin-antitoxin system